MAFFSKISKLNLLKIIPDNKKTDIIIHSIVAFVFAAICFIFGIGIIVSLVGGALLWCALHFKFEFQEDFKSVPKFIYLVISALIIFIIMQTNISCGIFLIYPLKFIANIILILGGLSLIWLISGSIKVSIVSVGILCTIMATVDFVMVQARSFELQFSDIMSIGTGLSVASKYSFRLDDVAYLGVILNICFLTFVIRSSFPKDIKPVKRIICSSCGVLAAVLFGIVVYTGFCSSAFGYIDKYWKFRGSEKNGFFVNMIYSASATRIITPEDYNPDELEEEVNTYIGDSISETETSDNKPNVIVIMNETFSDVQNICKYNGFEIPTTSEVTPFLDSLDSNPNVVKGYALASVYGGNTANSELEVLSGFSMQFMPRNTVAYNLYVKENNAFTIVDLYNKAGYTTIGMHPEDPTNWQRNKIYPYFGFDQTYFKDDFDTSEPTDIYRDHISDSSVYKKIESLFESKGDSSLFLFAVTMQNHGGYSSPRFDYSIDISGYENYSGVKEYLSCINNSDNALKDLISYFENVDEDTVILFFGDHQPSLSSISSKFYGLKSSSSVEEEQIKYVVPFFFWSNYDISSTDIKDFTSLNFLSTYLLDMTNVEASQYLKALSKLDKEIAALNAFGYFDNDMNFHETTYKDPALSPSLKLFSALQYNALFDSTNKKTSIFSLSK